jgi:hypothetical protein
MHFSVTVLFLGTTTRRRGKAHISELGPDSKRATPASQQTYTAGAYLHKLWSSFYIHGTVHRGISIWSNITNIYIYIYI